MLQKNRRMEDERDMKTMTYSPKEIQNPRQIEPRRSKEAHNIKRESPKERG